MAVECIERLRPFGKTLRDATDHFVQWLTNEQKKHDSLLVRECIDQYTTSRQADRDRGELSKLSFYEIRDRAKKLSEAMGGLHIAAVTPETVKTYLDSIPFSPRTRINIRLRMSKFFNFCKSKGWIERNPCEDVEIKAKRADTQILSVAEAKHLLAKAKESEFKGVAVPYAALCLFAGLRPGEAEQLDWKQVHFATKTIEVLAHTSKTRDSRFVKMEPTLVKWLKPYAKDSGRIVGVNFRPKWETVKTAAGYDPTEKEVRWVQDIMRHSYASYWLAIHQNRAELAELMGNSVEIIRAHYRRPILPVTAKKFWAALPKN
jgi:integrase